MAMTNIENIENFTVAKQIVGSLIHKKVFCIPGLQVSPLDSPSQMMETVMDHHPKQDSSM